MNNTIWNDEEHKIVITPSGNVDGYKYYFVNVKSNVFSGEYDFCISNETIELIISNDLTNLNVEEAILIDDYDSDSFIKFTIADNLGKVIVNGFIGGSHRENNMKFEFSADQTILQNLVNIFKQN